MQMVRSQDQDQASRASRGFAHELMRDWQRWTKAERVTAGCLVAIIFLGVSFFIVQALAAQPI